MITSEKPEVAPSLRDLPSRLLSQVAMAVGRVVSQALSAEEASRYQFAVLATLHDLGAQSQAELCRRTGIDRSDMNAITTGLEAEGHVTRRTDPKDRRQNVVALTKGGQNRYAALNCTATGATTRICAIERCRA